MKTLWGFALAFVLLGTPAHADPEPQEPPDILIPDRPDQSTSPYTVGSGRVQLESGPYYLRNKDGTDQGGLNQLLRVGTGPNTEVRLDGDFPQFGPSNFGGGTTGVSDLGLGFKANLTRDDWGGLGLLARLQFPTGNHGLAGNAVVPQVGVLTDFVLSDDWALDVTLGANLPQDTTGQGRYLQGFFASSFGYGVSDNVGLFAELFGQGPDDAGGPFEVGVDSGVTWLLNDNLQLDLAAQKGLSATGLDWGITLGASARY